MVLAGVLASVAVYTLFDVIIALSLRSSSDQASAYGLFLYGPIGLAVLSLVSLVGGILMILKGDRGFGIGMLSGWALGVIVGAGVCFQIASA
jgi:hypothetical protein